MTAFIHALSKLAVVLFTYKHAGRLKGSRVTGKLPTSRRHKNQAASGRLRRLFDSPGKKGARTSVYLASSPDVERVSSEYFSDYRSAKSSPLSHNKDVHERFWDLLKRMLV